MKKQIVNLNLVKDRQIIDAAIDTDTLALHFNDDTFILFHIGHYGEYSEIEIEDEFNLDANTQYTLGFIDDKKRKQLKAEQRRKDIQDTERKERKIYARLQKKFRDK